MTHSDSSPSPVTPTSQILDPPLLPSDSALQGLSQQSAVLLCNSQFQLMYFLFLLRCEVQQQGLPFQYQVLTLLYGSHFFILLFLLHGLHFQLLVFSSHVLHANCLSATCNNISDNFLLSVSSCCDTSSTHSSKWIYALFKLDFVLT